MKHSLRFCLFVFFCLGMHLFVSVVQADDRIIHVMWSYDGIEADFFNLYREGADDTPACESPFPPPSPLEMDCLVSVDGSGTPIFFTMTAVKDDYESPHSEPFPLYPPVLVDGNYVPQARLSASITSGEAPLPVTFDASGSSDIDGEIITYTWKFGDGKIEAGSDIDYTFFFPGTYTASVTVTDDSLATDTAAITVTVMETNDDASSDTLIPPAAVINATLLDDTSSLYRFDAHDSYANDAYLTFFHWDFGDGTIAVGEAVEHAYSSQGDYTVTLTVLDSKNEIGQSTKDIYIHNNPPLPQIGSYTTKRLIHLSWDYSGERDTLSGFRFYQNGNQVCETTDTSVFALDCIIDLEGIVSEFRLTAVNTDSIESTESNILVFKSGETASVPVKGAAPLSVFFNGGGSIDTDGSIISYHWDFGDGAEAEGAEATHTFTTASLFPVTLTVTDDKGATAQAEVVITVTAAANDAPVAVTDIVVIDEHTQVGINVLANDFDPDGDSLILDSVSQPVGGTVVISGNNALYTPGLDFNGDDPFTYVVSDGNGGTAIGTVNVTVFAVNDAPATVDQSLATDEGLPVSGILSAIDIDNDSLTFSISGNGSLGSAVITNSATGAFTYSPDPRVTGTDTFTFVANDGTTDSDTGTITIVITAGGVPEPNSVPLAFDGEFTGIKNVDLTGFLDADDPDGDALTFSIISSPTMGSVVINNAATGSFTYSPIKSLYGTDSFSFKVNDGKADSNVAVVSLIINKK